MQLLQPMLPQGRIRGRDPHAGARPIHLVMETARNRVRHATARRSEVPARERVLQEMQRHRLMMQCQDGIGRCEANGFRMICRIPVQRVALEMLVVPMQREQMKNRLAAPLADSRPRFLHRKPFLWIGERVHRADQLSECSGGIRAGEHLRGVLPERRAAFVRSQRHLQCNVRYIPVLRPAERDHDTWTQHGESNCEVSGPHALRRALNENFPTSVKAD
jgi:hypothetical protein